MVHERHLTEKENFMRFKPLLLFFEVNSKRPSPESLHRLSRGLRRLVWMLPLFLTILAFSVEIIEHPLVEGEPISQPFFLIELTVFALLGPTLVFFVLSFTSRVLTLWEQALLDLQQLASELEDKVHERTRELEEKNRALQQANQELRAVDQLKSDFIALVSHELLTPLTTINGGLELALAEGQTLSQEVKQRLNLLYAESQRLTRLVQRILEISRLEAGKVRLNVGPIAVRPLLNRVLDGLTEGRTVHLRYETIPPPILGDEIYVEEILRNLVHNAVKHTPPNTPLEVAVESREKTVVITITDHGPGIPPHLQNHIFSAFFQIRQGERRNASGWGLGLYLAFRLAELHGGRLWVESPVFDDPHAPGSRFYLELPSVTEEETDEPGAPFGD